MLSKLKFAIAIHAEADIFLMDEFFGGVGDESFKAKSTAVFKNTFVDGRTIIHVSHQLKTIADHSSRLLVLDRSKLLHCGDVEEGLEMYRGLFKK